jgi:phosphoglycolate phosphatase-like HAD superfamily hydrolase
MSGTTGGVAGADRVRRRRSDQWQAVLLDIDGTLVDSNGAHAWAWTEALREHGHQVDYSHVRRLIGMGSDKFLRAAAGIDERSADGQAVTATKKELFERLVPELRPTHGARALVERFERERLRIVLATSAAPDEVELLMHAAGLEHLIPAATTGHDVAETKPAPDLVHAALVRANVSAAKAVLIGDTPYDMASASAAAVAAIAFRCGGFWTDRELAGALAIYDDPYDLVLHYDESPFAGSRAD